ncbi:tryptophanyl-tRNA synthetase [Cordyceps militaris]|uniref:Tryptophan--tRNA ligase, mitochondrial n=1 Tax=Cordyceps militaris TaxID=73501 RepID=A0A2H4S8L1_CORMI|nr:tryptophanyl-tRNA synthetase [Cordyceps militaris]
MRRLLSTQSLQPRVIFSGIQPTGVPHLGNYAGALRQWVQRQREEPESTRLLYSIVDLHAITVPQNRTALRKAKRDALASLLAIGIDPSRCTLFYQSDVSAHSELMWILSCTASVGYLSRMTQWKSKLSLEESSHISDGRVGNKLKLGLFSYPVLQAADILVHRATHVPVGHDQQQHIEFARECVTNFNHAYGPQLVSPEIIILRRVMSLTEPTSKMSKSHPLERSRILLTDDADTIHAKISSALTDSLPGVTYDIKTRPGISNLLDIYSIFNAEGKTAAQLASDFSEASPRELKAAVSEAVIKGMDGFARRYKKLVEDTKGKKARHSADETMHLVREAMGL